MHIGFLSFESPFGAKGGGVASYLRAMIPSLIEAGHRVTLITSSGESDVNPYPDMLRILAVKLSNAHWYLSKLPIARQLLTLPIREAEWSFGFQRVLAQAMRDEPMDVLEVTELGSWWVARHPGAPLVLRLHGAEYTFSRFSGEKTTPGSAWNRRLQRQALRHADVVTAPSHAHASEVAREMNWAADRIAVVPNVIAADMLDRAAGTQAAKQSSEAPVILYTGRLAPVKGTSILIDCAAQVLKEFPRAQFVLAGGWQMPAPPSDWPSWMERAGAAGRITRLGHQNSEQLAELYRRATVFVMPSYYETFGISCLEAMAFQVPVVATRAGALPEVIEHDHVGLTVEPGDPAALASAICRLLAQPELRQRLGTAGRERVLSRYTAAAVRDQMVAAYQQARELVQ